MLDFNEASDDGVAVASAGAYAGHMYNFVILHWCRVNAGAELHLIGVIFFYFVTVQDYYFTH